jgi:hypothetical protein
MSIQAVTVAIRHMIENALHEDLGLPPDTLTVAIGPPDFDNDRDDLILFPLRINPEPDLRSSDHARRPADPTQQPERFRPVLPVEVHYLVTAGSPAHPKASEGLARLGCAMLAIEGGSPLSVPAAFQDAVWLSLEPMSTDELARIWGLFPNFNCRTCFVFRAAPIWLEGRVKISATTPVIGQRSAMGRLAEAR